MVSQTWLINVKNATTWVKKVPSVETALLSQPIISYADLAHIERATYEEGSWKNLPILYRNDPREFMSVVQVLWEKDKTIELQNMDLKIKMQSLEREIQTKK